MGCLISLIAWSPCKNAQLRHGDVTVKASSRRNHYESQGECYPLSKYRLSKDIDSSLNVTCLLGPRPLILRINDTRIVRPVVYSKCNNLQRFNGSLFKQFSTEGSK